MKAKVATGEVIHVGAQDPELKNSPVAWESDEDTEALREAIPEEPECYFNDRAYRHGAVVQSGDSRLRCDFGLWIPADRDDVDRP
jgi:hypothetical protein